MKKPFIYVSVPRSTGADGCAERIDNLCRTIYETGYIPYCPGAYLPHFLNDRIPAEHKDGIDVSRFMLRQSKMLVLCGEPDEEMKNEMAMAERFKVPATTLEGYLSVKGYGMEAAPEPAPRP